MPQPQLTREAVEKAFAKFDRDFRHSKDLKGWEDNKAHKFAIVYQGRRYPVKWIVPIASNVPRGKFSGGRHPGDANDLIGRLGFTVVPLRGSNPDWVRDELILTLNLYLQHRPNPPGKTSKEVRELSGVLIRLGDHLFPSYERSPTFRNLDGVYMKLMNFRRLDPQYTGQGKSGLTRGAKAEEGVWREFSNDPKRCREAADAIVALMDDPEVTLGTDSGDVEEAAEGRLLTRKHLARERSRELVASKKKQALKKNGKLACEACGFDFAAYYGMRGEGFIECHHTKPVSTLTQRHKTRLDDLALVCANCHRIIHKEKPWFTIEEVHALLPRDKN